MKGLAIVALVGLAAIGVMMMNSSAVTSDIEGQFGNYIGEFKKSYSNQAEYEMRMKIFTDNVKIINEHNSKGASWFMRINQFADWTQEEFKQVLGYRPTGEKVERQEVNFNGVTADSKDWVKDGAVNAVQNQGSCGSCWAFGTIGTVEGAYFVQNQKLLKFSESELVDCCHDDCEGCNGGFQNSALGWLEENKICLESEYSYKAYDRNCQINKCTAMGPDPIVKDFVKMETSQQALVDALNIVPVSVTVDASTWSFYGGGVFEASDCDTELNHAVLGTGYNKDSFTIKNSWGNSWGENGFIRVRRISGEEGVCGSYMDNSYAITV